MTFDNTVDDEYRDVTRTSKLGEEHHSAASPPQLFFTPKVDSPPTIPASSRSHEKSVVVFEPGQSGDPRGISRIFALHSKPSQKRPAVHIADSLPHSLPSGPRAQTDGSGDPSPKKCRLEEKSPGSFMDDCLDGGSPQDIEHSTTRVALLSEDELLALERPDSEINDSVVNHIMQLLVAHRPEWRVITSYRPSYHRKNTDRPFFEYICVANCQGAPATVILHPMHVVNHWVLAIKNRDGPEPHTNPASDVWEIADSIDGPSIRPLVVNFLEDIENKILGVANPHHQQQQQQQQQPKKPKPRSMPCAQQENAQDCGVYVLINAIFLICDRTQLPGTFHHIPLWRRVLAHLARFSAGGQQQLEGPSKNATTLSFLLDNETCMDPSCFLSPGLADVTFGDGEDWLERALRLERTAEQIRGYARMERLRRVEHTLKCKATIEQILGVLTNLRGLNKKEASRLKEVCEQMDHHIQELNGITRLKCMKLSSSSLDLDLWRDFQRRDVILQTLGDQMTELNVRRKMWAQRAGDLSILGGLLGFIFDEILTRDLEKLDNVARWLDEQSIAS